MPEGMGTRGRGEFLLTGREGRKTSAWWRERHEGASTAHLRLPVASRWRSRRAGRAGDYVVETSDAPEAHAKLAAWLGWSGFETFGPLVARDHIP